MLKNCGRIGDAIVVWPSIRAGELIAKIGGWAGALISKLEIIRLVFVYDAYREIFHAGI